MVDYPKYKFSCNCIYDIAVIKDQKNREGGAYHCPEHKFAKLAFVVRICVECGTVFDAPTLGKKHRCDACLEIHNENRIADYHKKYAENGYKALGIYNKRVNGEQSKTLEKSGAKPDPVIVNKYRAPCLQGCTYQRYNKLYEPCVSCEYVLEYDILLRSSFMPTLEPSETSSPRWNNRSYSAAL